MKRLLLLTIFVFFSLPAFSQLVVSPSDDGKAYQYAYGKAVAITQARVGVVYRFTLDDGEKSTVLIDKNGDPLVFKSMWSCLNYMTLQGWQVLNISLEYKEFLFRRGGSPRLTSRS